MLHNYNYNILNTLQKVEKESTQQVSFDKLKLNPSALDIIDELPILNSFAETSLQEISDFDPEGLLKSGNSSAVLDEKKKRKLMNRIQKAELKIDKELFNMEKDDNLPHIPLRHKRVMANNDDAKKKLKMFIDVKQRVKEVSKKKPAYISGDILGKTILEFNDIEEKSPVALLGSIKLDENEEENDSGLGKLTSLILASKKRRKQRKAKTIAEIGERSEKKLNLFPVEMIDTNEDCTISERKVEKEYVLASLDEESGMNEEIINTNKGIQTFHTSPLGNNHTKSILKPRTFKRTNTDLGSQTIDRGKFPISQQEKQNFLVLEEIKTQAITEQPIINKPAAEYIEGFDSLQTTSKPKANTVEIKEEDKIIQYEETKSGYISSDSKIGSKSSFLKGRNSHFYEICYNYEDNNKVLVRKNTLEIDLYERNLQKGSQTQNNQTYQKELMFENTPAYQSDLSPSLSLAEIKQEVMKVAPTLEKIKNEPISPNKPIFLGNILSPELKSTFNSQQSISNPYKRQESVHNNNPSKSILRLVGEEVVKDRKMTPNISQFGLKSPEGQRIRNDYSTPSTSSITQSKKNSEIRKDNSSPSRDSVISVFNTLDRNKEGVIEPFYKARKNKDLKNLNGKSPSIQDTVLDEETLDIPGNYLVKNLNNRKEKDSSQLGGRGASRKEDRLDFLSYFKYKQW